MISGPFVGQKRESLAHWPYTGYFIKEYVNVITELKNYATDICLAPILPYKNFTL